MAAQACLNMLREIQNHFLEYIDKDDDEKNLQILSKAIDDNKIRENRSLLKMLMLLIYQIGTFYPHGNNFFNKITQVILIIKDDIIKTFSPGELINLLSPNSRLILILFDEKIVTVDEQIAENLSSRYFVFEKKPFISQEEYNSVLEEEPNIDEKRHLGENDSEYADLIRKDDIDGFIQLLKKNGDNVRNIVIRPSIFDPNPQLMEEQSWNRYLDLNQYAAAFGSIKIFKYLLEQKQYFTDSIWKYAVFGRNKEIIQIVEEDEPNIPKDLILDVILTHNKESIDFLLSKMNSDVKNKYENDIIRFAISANNYVYIDDDKISSFFLIFCKYSYTPIVKALIESKSVDINEKDANGINALYYAISLNDMEIFNFLVKQDGIDVCAKCDNYYNHTPLTIAATKDRMEMIKILLERDDIDINARCKNVFKLNFGGALNIAIENNNIELIKLLLTKDKIDVNAGDFILNHIFFFFKCCFFLLKL